MYPLSYKYWLNNKLEIRNVSVKLQILKYWLSNKL